MFMAALLTVIGYSINDSVVVFDRIRELRRDRQREPLREVANDACLQTVPRTINTGLGALFILVALYLLGGETLRDFALALLIGIVVGTYSSVFTATPLALRFEALANRSDTPSSPLRPQPANGVLAPKAPTRTPTATVAPGPSATSQSNAAEAKQLPAPPARPKRPTHATTQPRPRKKRRKQSRRR